MSENITVHYPPIFHYRAIEFRKHYDLVSSITCPESKLKTLKTKADRTCRFCNRKFGQTYFNKEAHIISRMLGNRYLISDFECDNCNEIFGKYENDLAYYIGPLRAFQNINEGDDKNKFKSPNKQVVTETTNFYGAWNCVSISREDCLDQTFEI